MQKIFFTRNNLLQILSSIWVKALSIKREEDNELTDAEIIDLYWNRDQAAITQTANQYGNYCYAIANGILSNHEDSEECLNDTWHRAWEAMPPQRPNKLTLFLGKITRHLAFDKYKMSRAKKRGGSEFSLVLDELDECIPSSNTVEQTIETEELERTTPA